jgi:hypothetical protein
MSEYAPGSYHFAERIMELNVQERHREAEYNRLSSRSKARRPVVQRFYCAALASFGNHLSAWGEHLVERYSSEPATPVRQSA